MTENNKLSSIYENCVLNEMAYGLSHNATLITSDQLMQKLGEMTGQGSKEIELLVVSKPKKDKNIYKISRMKGKIGTPYKKEVEKQRGLEGVSGEFKSYSTYGEYQNEYIKRHTPATGDYKGILTAYLNIIPTGSDETKYIDMIVDPPKLLTKEEGKILFPAYTGKTLQAHQGVQNTVQFRTVAFPNIAGINIDGTEYRITTISPNQMKALQTANIIEQDPDSMAQDDAMKDIAQDMKATM